jgi:hypothetical protein
VSITTTAPVSLAGPFTRSSSLQLIEVRGRCQAFKGVQRSGEAEYECQQCHAQSSVVTYPGGNRQVAQTDRARGGGRVRRREEETPMSDRTR